jgi:hypothetical protein
MCTLADALSADPAEDLVDSSDGLLVLDDVAVLGGHHDQVERLDGDVEEGVLVRLHVGVLLVGIDELGKGTVDVLHRVLGHALELPRESQLPVLVADSHCQNHHFKYYIRSVSS